MSRIRIAVVYGGRSSEHGISAVSAGSVIKALDPGKYDVVAIGISPDGEWLLTDVEPEALRVCDRTVPEVSKGIPVVLAPDPTRPQLLCLDPLGGVRALDPIDVVFPVLHGRFGEDGAIQGLLELAGLPFVGAGVFASAAGMDKEFSKKLLGAAGLDVGRYVVLRRGDSLDKVASLGLPVFVKPARAGSSVGISKVRSMDGLPAALDLALSHDAKVLVEAAVVGREVECGVLEGVDGRPTASLPAEIRVVRGHEWYDYDAKYLDDACEFDVPAQLPPELTAAIREAACQAFTAIECAGLARVDFFIRPDGSFVVNELNTMPGFTPISMFPRMWEASGVSYPELVDRLVQSALRR